MFCKLAFKNVTKSLRDYTVYFLTLMFSVCLFYMFNSIDSQTAMMQISQSQQNILHNLISLINYVSVFISVILGFLVVYANRFLMKRRKKELGVYMTLGMPRGKISLIVLLETFLIGLLSLAVGLIVGIFASQGLSVVTAKLFEAPLKAFIFTFSSKAFYKTFLYFGIIFVVVMIFNTVSVSRLKLIDLLTAGKKNERLRINRLWISAVIFLISVACLTAAYILIEKSGMLNFDKGFTASILLGCVGTVLFFLSLSGFLLRVVQSNKKLYFKNLNMFILRQFNSKINTTFVSVSVICIMLLITIGTLSTGMGLSSVLSQNLKASTPYDISLIHDEPHDAKNVSWDIAAKAEKSGVGLSEWASRYYQVTAYESDVSLARFVTNDDMKKLGANVDGTHYLEKAKLEAISVSDYNGLMMLQGKPSLSLSAGQYALNCSFDSLVSVYGGKLSAGQKIMFNGKALTPVSASASQVNFRNSGNGSDIGTLIVPDNLVKGLAVSGEVLNAHYRPGINEANLLGRLNAVSDKKNAARPFNQCVSKTEIYEQAAGYKVLISYLALYIGLVFLIAAAAVLALQQLSEASDNIERYGLLRKLGAEENMVNRSLFIQIALYFALPLSLAIVHCIVGIDVASKAISIAGGYNILSSIVFTAAVFLIIYGAYFLATYFGCKNMIRQKEIYARAE